MTSKSLASFKVPIAACKGCKPLHHSGSGRTPRCSIWWFPISSVLNPSYLYLSLTILKAMTDMKQPQPVDLLILGAGWTSTFLIPLLETSKISYAATTTTGRDNTISFKFDPESNDLHPYKLLPTAKTVLITFPLNGTGQSKKIVELYQSVHSSQQSSTPTPNWIQLGSTGIFSAPGWNDYTSPYNKENARSIAEDELLHLKICTSTVLNLAGLYDDENRKPRNWVARVAKTKVTQARSRFD
jgi:hypothetical protein